MLKKNKLLAGLGAFLITTSQIGYSNPQGGTVVQGSASLSTSGLTATINQTSNRAVIDWQGFSINSDEITQFNQPSINAATLNRVVSGNPSAIYGQLKANGSVYLINPNGIIVGSTGVINTQSFLASTLDVSNDEFMAGGSQYFSGDSDASITNLGQIEAVGGDVYLFAQNVSNEGSITAAGHLGLAGSNELYLVQQGKERIAVSLTGSAGSVDNSGIIEAAQAELKAVGNNPFALAINQTGIIRATGFTRNEDGSVILQASNGATALSGSIAAAGGSVDVLGDSVNVSGEIDVSGSNGGGSVHIGGEFQGQGSTQTSQQTIVTKDATIKANAIESGDGGEVIVWSDDTSSFKGTIEARSAGEKGDYQGGFVEVSGKQHLDFEGLVDTNGGILMLDPSNYEITSVAATLTNASTIAAATIITNLASSNVIIDTSGIGTDDGDIRISEEISYDSTNDLTFLAHRHIEINASVQNRNDTGGDVNLVAGWDGSTTFDATIFAAEDVSTTTLFGNNLGSIYIGDGTQTSGIAVGSRSGANNVFG
ncbi:MAG: filamentous hemagglutinin N-terminal domain-containing protein, partial [Gammaproteobacteria bacterium]|nr:filamentous hemagglutinin N-terminal domain-containing protein [Gammaproteobacteria bacterium]